MLQTLANAFKVPELRKKLLYTALVILIFRLGAAIPVPFTAASMGLLANDQGSFMQYFNMITGDAFNYGTLFAMSITPYINASIIMQLLTAALPPLEKLAQQGEDGRKKIQRITRYTAIAIALLQSAGYYFYLKNSGHLATAPNGAAFTGVSSVLQALVIVLVLTAGSSFLMWVGEQINVKGIGNGISIILFAGIVSRIPTVFGQIISSFGQGGWYYFLAPLAIILLVAMVIFIVWMDNSERRIPVQYAKRVVGRKMYGGQNTHIPIKVNMSGVMPIIFASSFLSIPPTILMFFKVKEGTMSHTIINWFYPTHWVYGLIYLLLIVFFAYFYASIQYNPIEMANHLRKNSGAIPGIRPGKPTSDYIHKILLRMILLSALMVAVVALSPILFSQITSLIPQISTGQGKGMNIALGGTSIIILVGVALETVRQLESQLMMRHYKGFLD